MIHVGCNSCLCVVASSLFSSLAVYYTGQVLLLLLFFLFVDLSCNVIVTHAAAKNNFYPPAYHMCKDRDSRLYHRVRSGGGEWENGTEAAIHTTAQNERKKHESERTLFRATWQLPRCFFYSDDESRDWLA